MVVVEFKQQPISNLNCTTQENNPIKITQLLITLWYHNSPESIFNINFHERQGYIIDGLARL